jgi:hypothetical protein
MISDRLNKIMDTLCYVTISGVLIWEEKNKSSKDRSHKRTLHSVGEDSTAYEMEVKYTLSGNNWIIEASPSIWIRNKTLPGGQMYVTSYNCENVKKIRDVVKDKYCSDMSPRIEDVEDILSDIEKGISLSTYRENKLNKIL